MTDMTATLCSDENLAEVLALAQGDEPAALGRIALLLDDCPQDPRLHFLKGSLLAGQQQYAEGLVAMRHAVALAPGYDIARFQLGLLELSSGDAEAADATLQPLADAIDEKALSLFALGLRHLARDNFDRAETLLRRGIEINDEHPLVSRDMQLMLAGIADARAAQDALAESPPTVPDENARAAPEEDVSADHLLLQRYADKSTKH
jgi:tetratricopeptide (TPR) repeat protein